MPELDNFGRGKSTSILTADIPVSLNGTTLGKYRSGAVIPAKGKTVQQVLADIASEAIYPTYYVAQVGIEQSVPALGEVGERVFNQLTGTFYRNDGGAVQRLRIERNGQLLAQSPTSPVRAADEVVRSLAPVHYVALADYAAGTIKPVQPAGTPDDRPALPRNPGGPQAADTNLPSGQLTLAGCYRLFYGAVASAPAASAAVRALPNGPLAPGPLAVTLNTGSTYTTFAVAVPPGLTLVSATDITALGAVVTGEYRPSPIQVEDAAGQLVAYTLYLMRPAGAYTENHQHQLVFSA